MGVVQGIERPGRKRSGPAPQATSLHPSPRRQGRSAHLLAARAEEGRGLRAGGVIAAVTPQSQSFPPRQGLRVPGVTVQGNRWRATARSCTGSQLCTFPGAAPGARGEGASTGPPRVRVRVCARAERAAGAGVAA